MASATNDVSELKVDGEEEEDSMETAFENEEELPWTKQITIRSVVTGFLLSILFTFIVTKLNLTTGIIPSLNVTAGLLGYTAVASYTALLKRFGLLVQPFTRQENTVIQTFVVASSGIAFSSGIGSYLLGMSPRIAAQSDSGSIVNSAKELQLSWIIGFLFLVSFVGLFSILGLRKTMILDKKLTYPSGTATAHLINSFHTPKGAKKAKEQVSVLFKAFCGSFAWSGFQWFFSSGDGCGFSNYPIFGLTAYKQRFYFDFSTTYIGCGMLTDYMVNISMLIGGIISWGIMWPLIERQKGNWYGADLSAGSLHGIQGYRVFISIAMILGDGLYNVASHAGPVGYVLIRDRLSRKKREEEKKRNSEIEQMEVGRAATYEDQNTKYFKKGSFPKLFAPVGYVTLAAISVICIPLLIFPQLKWFYIVVVYIIAPVLGFCNAYGCGLTDWSLASNYGKLAIVIFSGIIGSQKGGVIAGLAACGVMMNIVSTASDLMQDFKTGYLTRSSPRSMFLSQVLGTALGCVTSPLVFWFFYKAYAIGDPSGPYPAPFGQIYRGIALLAVDGIGSLPKNCFALTITFFALAIGINIVATVLKRYETKYKIYRFVPNPMAMAIPFYLGSYFVFDMCLGSLIVFLWKRKNKKQAEDFRPAVASGMICGESVWGVPAAILSLFNVKAPICMKFLSSKTNAKVDGFLAPI